MKSTPTGVSLQSLRRSLGVGAQLLPEVLQGILPVLDVRELIGNDSQVSPWLEGGRQYGQSRSIAGGAAANAMGGVSNPAGSGVLVYVDSICVVNTSGAVQRYALDLAPGGGVPATLVSLLSLAQPRGAGAVQVAVSKFAQSNVLLYAAIAPVQEIGVLVGESKCFNLPRPMPVFDGDFFVVACQNVNASMTLSVTIREYQKTPG